MNATKVVPTPHPEQRRFEMRHVPCGGTGTPKERRPPGAKRGLQAFHVGGVDPTQFNLGRWQDRFGGVWRTLHDAPFDGLSPLAHAVLDDLNAVESRPHDQARPTALPRVDRLPKSLPERTPIGPQASYGKADRQVWWCRRPHLLEDVFNPALVAVCSNGAPQKPARAHAQGGGPPGLGTVHCDRPLIGVHLAHVNLTLAHDVFLNRLSVLPRFDVPIGNRPRVHFKREHNRLGRTATCPHGKAQSDLPRRIRETLEGCSDGFGKRLATAVADGAALLMRRDAHAVAPFAEWTRFANPFGAHGR